MNVQPGARRWALRAARPLGTCRRPQNTNDSLLPAPCSAALLFPRLSPPFLSSRLGLRAKPLAQTVGRTARRRQILSPNTGGRIEESLSEALIPIIVSSAAPPNIPEKVRGRAGNAHAACEQAPVFPSRLHPSPSRVGNRAAFP